jgi:hypothetical protein
MRCAAGWSQEIQSGGVGPSDPGVDGLGGSRVPFLDHLVRSSEGSSGVRNDPCMVPPVRDGTMPRWTQERGSREEPRAASSVEPRHHVHPSSAPTNHNMI